MNPNTSDQPNPARLLLKMGTRWTGTIHAGLDERFAQHAFDSMTGNQVPLKLGDRVVGMAIVVGAVVADDGRSAEVTWEVQ